MQRAHAAVTGLALLDVPAEQLTRHIGVGLVGPTNGIRPRRWSTLHACKRASRRASPGCSPPSQTKPGRLVRAELAVRARAQSAAVTQVVDVSQAVFVTRQESILQGLSQRRSARILSR